MVKISDIEEYERQKYLAEMQKIKEFYDKQKRNKSQRKSSFAAYKLKRCV